MLLVSDFYMFGMLTDRCSGSDGRRSPRCVDTTAPTLPRDSRHQTRLPARLLLLSWHSQVGANHIPFITLYNVNVSHIITSCDQLRPLLNIHDLCQRHLLDCAVARAVMYLCGTLKKFHPSPLLISTYSNNDIF